jgi:phosphatidylglycerophosphatase A
MNKIKNKNGKKIFYILFSLNIIATLGERIFPIFYLDSSNYIPQTIVSIIILFFLFYGIGKGYNWLKYILIILGFFGTTISINNALDIYSTKIVVYDSRKITDDSILAYVIAYILFINGLIYLSTSLLFLFSKNMKAFLSIKRNSILLL